MTITIGGFVPFTTIDYPGHLSAVVFCKGCPLRCVYCHNKHLQINNNHSDISWETVFDSIKNRKNIIEAVVFSGGEPLIYDDLYDYMCEVKKIGLKIGLHTSGICVENFKKVLGVVDWVGFDIKHLFEKYSSITKIDGSGEKSSESFEYLLNYSRSGGENFEARITLFHEIDVEDVKKILEFLIEKGVKKIALQQCRNEKNIIVEHPIIAMTKYLNGVAKLVGEGFLIR